MVIVGGLSEQIDEVTGIVFLCTVTIHHVLLPTQARFSSTFLYSSQLEDCLRTTGPMLRC